MRKHGDTYKYSDKYPEMLIQHMADGGRFETFAGVIGVGRTTIYEWLENKPEFAMAKDVGHSKSFLYWENLGKRAALGKINNFAHKVYSITMANSFGVTDSREIKHSGEVKTGVQVYLPDNKRDNAESKPKKKK